MTWRPTAAILCACDECGWLDCEGRHAFVLPLPEARGEEAKGELKCARSRELGGLP
jgi:hypothetical protein